MSHLTDIYVELYKREDYSSFGLFDKQITALKALRDSKTNEILYGGGSRGGKSWTGCLWQTLNRLSMPESAGLIAREELSKLKDTTQRTFFKVAKSIGLEQDKDFKFNGQDNLVKFPNGSILFFREIKYLPSDDQFDRLGSYDLTDVFLDEAQQIHWRAREVLRGRLSVLSGDGWRTIPKAFYSCNPAKNWIYTDFVRPSQRGELNSDMIFIKSLATDNPYVDQDYIDNLAKADQVTKERLLFGNFEYDDDPSALVDYDAICDLFTNDHVKPNGKKYISADLAMQGRDKFIGGHWEGLIGHVDIVKKKATGKEIETDILNLKRDKGVPNSNIVADSDGLGAYLDSYIPNMKTFHGGSSAMNLEFANLKSECAFKLAEYIQDRKMMIVCSKEEQEEIKTEISVCLKRDNVNADVTKKKIISKDLMKEKLGRSPDFLDFLIMRMIFEIYKDSSEIEVDYY